MTHANDVIRESKGKVPTLNARMGTGGNQVPIVLNDQGGSVMNVEKETVGTLRAEAHGNNPVVAYCIAGNTIERQIQNGGNGKGVLEEMSYTLNTTDRHAVAQPYGGVLKAYAIGNGQADQLKMSEKVGALNCMHDQIAVMQECSHVVEDK